MVTNYGLYILIKKETNPSSDIDLLAKPHRSSSSVSKYTKEAFISHTQIDYIEVSLGQQAIHLACINKRQNVWITTASKNLTQHILEHIQIARLQSVPVKLGKISIFDDATSQKLAIKKFISGEEGITPQDVDISSYSFLFWEDQASAQNHLIYKEGTLDYYHKSGSSGFNEWKKGFFILK